MTKQPTIRTVTPVELKKTIGPALAKTVLEGGSVTVTPSVRPKLTPEQLSKKADALKMIQALDRPVTLSRSR